MTPEEREHEKAMRLWHRRQTTGKRRAEKPAMKPRDRGCTEEQFRRLVL